MCELALVYLHEIILEQNKEGHGLVQGNTSRLNFYVNCSLDLIIFDVWKEIKLYICII